MPSPPAPTDHPELPYSIEARIALAWKALVESDEDLMALFAADGRTGGVAIVEGSDLLEVESLEMPTLGIYIAASQTKPRYSSNGGQKLTALHLQLLTAPPASWGDTKDQFRLRICSRLELLALAHLRVLSDSGGDLSLAVTELSRVNYDSRRLPSLARLTVIALNYLTDVDLSTLEILP